MTAKHILDHATKVLDTSIDLDKAISWLQESRNENALAAIKALYLDEKAASSIEVILFEDLSKGELEPKQREALMRLVLRIDDISQNTKQAGLNLELIAQSKKRVPKEFWNMYKDLSKRFVAQTGALRSAIEAFGHSDDDVLKRREEVKNIEHHGDEIVHGIYQSLNQTFITPFDREDLIGLASGLDSILDMMYASALRMDLYKIHQSTKPMIELSDVIHNSVVELLSAFQLIRDHSKMDVIETKTVEVNRLENVADDLMNNAVANLFESRDPVEILKLKEIYEKLEEATDYCEDVADILNDIVAKTR